MCIWQSMLLLTCVTANSLGNTPQTEVGDELPVWVRFEKEPSDHSLDLRSAHLHRAWAPPVSHEDTVSDLQSHFDAVLEILIRDTPQSIETAIGRVERHHQTSLNESERRSIRLYLQSSRRRQIATLAGYRDRGRFPRNTIHPSRPVPVFVDTSGTACAVGYLMLSGGWRNAVAEIQRTNNEVYVSDVTGGPVKEWIIQSGLTQEEAAMIQPGYPFPGEESMSELMAMPEYIRDGMRYTNFRFSLVDRGATIASTADETRIFAGTDTTEHPGVYGPYMDTVLNSYGDVGNRFLFFGGPGRGELLWTEDSGEAIMHIGFDVEPVAAGTVFRGVHSAAVTLPFGFGGTSPPFIAHREQGDRLSFDSVVKNGDENVVLSHAMSTDDLGFPPTTTVESFQGVEGGNRADAEAEC